MLCIKLSCLQTTLVFRVINEVLAHSHREEGTYKDTHKRSGDTDFQNIEKRNVKAREQTEQGYCSRRDRRSRNGLLRCNDSDAQRTLGTYLCLVRHLSNHRQHRIGHVTGTCKKRKGICYQRSENCHILRIRAQNLLGNLDHIVKTAGSLHAGCRGDNCSNHHHHINGQFARLKPEYKCQQGNTKTTHHAKTDTAKACTDDYAYEHNQQLQEYHHQLHST